MEDTYAYNVDESKSFRVKVYLVFQVDNLAPQGKEKVLAAKLSFKSAKNLCDKLPGTRIEKFVATK